MHIYFFFGGGGGGVRSKDRNCVFNWLSFFYKGPTFRNTAVFANIQSYLIYLE